MKVSETDYLRAEVKREREEAALALRELQREHERETQKKDAEHEDQVARLHRRIESVERMRDSLAADLKISRFDMETARRFVADVTTTRKDKR